MWIERIDVAGFGNLSGERIEFQPNKLNLMVEPNDFGKSTIADAIWATLFDFPSRDHSEAALVALRAARRPNQAQTPYIVCLDLVSDDRPLKIIRDFEDGSVQVYDAQRGHDDVTGEFAIETPEPGEELGIRLCGVGRDTFLSTFHTGQRRLQRNLIAGNLEILSLLQNICESSAGAQSASAALAVLMQALSQFPYRGNPEKLDALIRTLESRQGELKTRISGLRSQRSTLGADLVEAYKAQKALRNTGVNDKAQEYFDLAVRVANLDEKISKAKGRPGRKRELQLELVKLADAQEFPVDVAAQVKDLWSRRHSKSAEYQRLEQDSQAAREQFASEQTLLKERLHGCDKFTMEDLQNLTVLANTIKMTQKEVTELVKRRQIEASRVRDQDSVDMDRVEEMRKSLHPLDSREVDSARTYDALIGAAQAQITESERLIIESRNLVDEIEAEKKNKKAVFFNASTHRKRESELAESQIQQQKTLLGELVAKVANLQKRLDVLAQKAGLANGAELLKHVQEYSTKSVAVRDIDALDHVLATRESIFSKNKQDLVPYFKKAEREDLAITAESAGALASDVSRYTEELRNMDAMYIAVKHDIARLDSMGLEITDGEGLLESIFMRAHMSDPTNLEASYAEFEQKLAAHERYKAINKEIGSMGGGDAVANPEDERRFDAERTQAFNKMQELVKRHPEIAEMTPPAPGTRMSSPQSQTDPQVAQAADNKLEQMRSAMNSFDQSYLDSVRELDGVDYDLTHLRQARAAIELARETLQRLSNESSYDWLDQLNGTLKRWSKSLGLDHDAVEFGTDLRVTVRRKGTSGSSAHIMHQLSASARQLVHLLSRLAVCDVLSKNKRLPIIVDEPLSEIDDDTFLRVMKFLLDEIVPHHQVIMFSSHRTRYEWLMQNLSAEQKQLIQICRKGALRPDAVH